MSEATLPPYEVALQSIKAGQEFTGRTWGGWVYDPSVGTTGALTYHGYYSICLDDIGSPKAALDFICHIQEKRWEAETRAGLVCALDAILNLRAWCVVESKPTRLPKDWKWESQAPGYMDWRARWEKAGKPITTPEIPEDFWQVDQLIHSLE